MVDRALTAAPNKIVVARVHDRLLLKRLQVRGRNVFLHSDPPELPALELGQHDEAAGNQGGAGLAQPFNSTFHTVPLPRLVGTQPTDGDRAAPPYTDFALFFNTPIDPATVMANIRRT